MGISRLPTVGTGLIGASVGRAAKKAGIDRVAGWDPDGATLAIAATRGAVDVAAPELEEALAGAEVAVVAAPVAVLVQQITASLEGSPEGCVVTDVGSTKAAVCGAVGDRVRFIGGHPLCGSEARGPEHASGELFQGATWFLTPVAETDPARYRTLHGLVASLGAIPTAVDPAAHDRLLALTSHLPHALANLLLNQAGSSRVDGHEALSAAGGSLKDMTRVAGANPRIWVDIFVENAEALGAALGEHRRRVEELERALAHGDAGFLARWIGEAAGNRRRLLEQSYDDAGALQRLTVHVSDRPGVFAGITQALAADGINIEDFDVHHMSPERGGTLEILVGGEEEAERAGRLLEAQGYSVIVAPAFDEDD
jgi:prephenate dehydrogenase